MLATLPTPLRRDTPRCLDAIRSANWSRAWYPATRSSKRVMTRSAQTVRCCESNRSKRCLLYVRNQKAGSSLLYSHMSQFFPNTTCRTGLARHPLAPVERRARDDVVFTVVREPFDVALSAYCEVRRRQACPRCDWTRVERFPRWCGVRPSDEFDRYLDDVRSGRFVSDEAFHSYPQTVKTLTSYRLEVVVRADALHAGLRGLAKLVGTSFVAMNATSKDRHTTRSDACCAGVRPLSSRLAARLCALYASDFECFGFPRPAVCQSVA